MAQQTVTLIKFICPRCDRPYYAPTADEVLEKVKTHVSGQHPDHDPLWYETYPEAFGN